MERNQTYINDLLKQYRDGSISDKDSHQLERIALDDPFLFDSLEGYATQNKSDEEKSLFNIKTKTSAPQGRIISMRSMSIAAGFAIIVAGLIWVNSQWNESNETDFSQVATEQVEETQEPNIYDKSNSEESEGFVGIKPGDLSGYAAPKELLKESTVTDKALNAIAPSSKIEADNVKDTESAAIVNSNDAEEGTREVVEKARIAEVPEAPVKSTVSDIPDPIVVETVVEEPNISVAQSSEAYRSAPIQSKKRKEVVAKDDPFGDALPEVMGSDVDLEEFRIRTITGLVRDNTGEPLIGANITVPNSNIGVSTDIDGSFQLEIDTAINQLNIGYTGFTDFVMEIDTTSTYAIVLDDQDALLDEVVVTGYASNVNEPQPSFVLPPGGRINYKEVLKKMAQSGCNETGKVKLKFTVTKYGEVTDFEVRKGLSEECNQRAIEIIKSSGRWDNQFNKDKKVRYTISF